MQPAVLAVRLRRRYRRPRLPQIRHGDTTRDLVSAAVHVGARIPRQMPLKRRLRAAGEAASALRNDHGGDRQLLLRRRVRLWHECKVRANVARNTPPMR